MKPPPSIQGRADVDLKQQRLSPYVAAPFSELMNDAYAAGWEGGGMTSNPPLICRMPVRKRARGELCLNKMVKPLPNGANA
jgi:hypothetical protein